jgi:hypothetical protein
MGRKSADAVGMIGQVVGKESAIVRRVHADAVDAEGVRGSWAEEPTTEPAGKGKIGKIGWEMLAVVACFAEAVAEVGGEHTVPVYAGVK